MIRVNWHRTTLGVRRLVLRSDMAADPQQLAIRPLACRYGLAVADDRTRPRPGDFWIGCEPTGGWADADPAKVGRAATAETGAAVLALIAGRYGYPLAVPE